jgi:hypothetical protein
MTRFLHNHSGHPDGLGGAPSFFISQDSFIFPVSGGGSPWYWITKDGWVYPAAGHPNGQSGTAHFWIKDATLYAAPSHPSGGPAGAPWYYIVDSPP